MIGNIKCLAQDTKILMYDGTNKKIQDVINGDAIMGENAQPVCVYKIENIKDIQYEVQPIRGENYIIGQNHNIILKASNYEMVWWDDKRKRFRARYMKDFMIYEKIFSLDKYGNKDIAEEEANKFIKNIVGSTKYGDEVIINIKKYYELPLRINTAYKCFSVGFNFKERNVIIDSYAIGYWLGDGTSAASQITTIEKEVIDYFTNYAKSMDLELKKKSKYGYNITTGTQYGGARRNPFFNGLRKYNLVNNKHIPADYLFNSRENRLKLLAGIIDSDGSYNNSNNIYDICFKSERLTDNVIFLARSLGFFTYKTKTKKTCTNSKNGPVTGNYFRFCICGKGLEDIPCLVPRKQAHIRESPKDANVNGIKIKKLDKGNCYKIQLFNSSKIMLSNFTIV